MLNTIVLFVHPRPQRSRVNSALREAISDLPNTEIHDLYEAYPDFYIDVKREQAKLLAHDLIVFQHPVYWYAAPALLKEWLDTVLEYGWAHGTNGNALRGKYWLQAITLAGTESSYGEGGRNRFPITEFLRPFEVTAYTCQMVWLPPFPTYGTPTLDSAAIAARAATYRERLATLQRDPESR